MEYLQEVLRFDDRDVKKEISKLNLDMAIVRENFLLTSEKLINIICEKYPEKPEAVKDKDVTEVEESVVTMGRRPEEESAKTKDEESSKFKCDKEGCKDERPHEHER